MKKILIWEIWWRCFVLTVNINECTLPSVLGVIFARFELDYHKCASVQIVSVINEPQFFSHLQNKSEDGSALASSH